jgi:protein-S-isoprenylcysteine O-methyltransferase Ste14
MNENTSPIALPPHYYMAANLVVTVCSLMLFYKLGINEKYIFLPVLALGIVYALLYLIRQCGKQGHTYTRFSIDKNIDLNLLLRRSVIRYLVWLVVIILGYQFYLLTPTYNTIKYSITHRLFEDFLYWYLWLGIPYFTLTLTFKSSRIEDFYDPAIRFLHVGKQISQQILLRLSGRNSHRSVFHVLRKQYNRKVFLNLISRAIFIPAMVGQFSPTLATVFRTFYQEPNNNQFLLILFLLVAVLWLSDVFTACVAYLLESRWLENRSRSIDLNITGWFVCLLAYYPINDFTSSIFAFAPFIVTNNINDLVINQPSLVYASKIFELILLGCVVYCDVSLGTSGANITLKKLQTKGLYGIVRHPGYTSKVLMWLVKSIIYKKFWTAKYLLGSIAWVIIYMLRALTEERHLKKFVEYREYCKKVKHRFFPGLF